MLELIGQYLGQVNKKIRDERKIRFVLKSVFADDRDVYLTGTFNNWNPMDPAYKMERVDEHSFSITVELPQALSTNIEYKYTKGGWDAVEVTKSGSKAPNRLLGDTVRQVTDRVPLFLTQEATTDLVFYPIIEEIDQFFMPQLGKYRKVRVMLPYNYYKVKKKYSVLYMQDGQNLWDKSAPFGNWDLDRKFMQMSTNGKNDLIIVAIDHGERERINEFNPFHGTTLGRGDGGKYIRFLVETLKPYVDRTYRTLPGRESTGVGGSSLGGLISIYAALQHPGVFSKLLIFSPSLWVTHNVYYESLRFFSPYPTKMYLYGGGKESRTMVSSLRQFKSNIENNSFNENNMNVKLSIDPAGHHTESKWGREFVSAINWLFYTQAT